MPCSWQKTNRSGDRAQWRDVMADRYVPDDDDDDDGTQQHHRLKK